MSALQAVLTDLAAESDELDSVVSRLSPDQWGLVTTPEGWTIAHQIGHLHWTDRQSLLAIHDAGAFNAEIAEFINRADTIVDDEAAAMAELGPAELLARWRTGRADLATALASVPAGEKVPWYGPPMSPISMATARVMETWAHSHDVFEALGLPKVPSDRVKNVCHLGIRTFAFAHQMRGEEVPEVQVRVELTAPSGDRWEWGPEGAEQRVSGDAWDFALLATRRRHRDDANVTAQGDVADHWLDIVQTFAGGAGNDPKRLDERG